MRAKFQYLLFFLALVVPVRAGDEAPPTEVAAPRRIVALGDLHGDMSATRAALKLAGAIDDTGHWVGGDLCVVQTGDEIDRGPDDLAILELFDRLAVEARQAGGALYALLGNHELMNCVGDLRYVTPESMKSSCPRMGVDPASCDPQRARLELFAPGGIFARILAKRNTVMIVGKTLFCHGGVRKPYALYGLDKLNQEIRSWLSGSGPQPSFLEDDENPVWARLYSRGPTVDAAELEAVFSTLGIERMVVGHTVQKDGITSAANGKVWRIDVGMAKVYGGRIEVLEIVGDTVRVLKP